MDKSRSLAISRIGDGFVASASDPFQQAVAETAERVTEIVAEWAGLGNPKLAVAEVHCADEPARSVGHQVDGNDLGWTAVDVITGFTGVITASAVYLTGCNQACLVPRSVDGNGAVNALWVDVQRLRLTDDAPIALDNGSTPGCDMPAPPAR